METEREKMALLILDDLRHNAALTLGDLKTRLGIVKPIVHILDDLIAEGKVTRAAPLGPYRDVAYSLTERGRRK